MDGRLDNPNPPNPDFNPVISERQSGIICDTRTRERGFVFIRGENGVSHFAHCRNFRSLAAFDVCKEGQRVEFNPRNEQNGKGNSMRAVEIEVLDAESAS